uniref:uncharacterized protein LOC127069020 isoform X1 n=1 Tax=Vespula vulgaris TaxID=7454 RepID=UPI0021421EF4|nr:uncharacterized protein LOC127069020 isoform X1 [Vespula vulgaris]
MLEDEKKKKERRGTILPTRAYLLSAKGHYQFRQVGSAVAVSGSTNNKRFSFLRHTYYIRSLSEACELDQMRYGCRIYNAQCSCGYGCKAEYRYDTNEDCKLALRGRLNDICYRSNPCLHGGSCSQISPNPGFKCRCEGTGYYGTRCEKSCPASNNLRYRGPFPYECVVI